MKKTITKLLALVLAVLMALSLAACGAKDSGAADKVELPVADGAVIGQGATAGTVEVTGADGVMLARGALGNPMIFAEIAGRDTSGVSLLSLIVDHLDTMKKFHEERYIVANFKKHATYYLKGIQGSKEARLEAYSANSVEEVKKVMSKYLR